MKKVIWIYSRNECGMPLYGMITPMTTRQSKVFQEKIKSSLASNIEIEFISYDIFDKKMLNANLIVCNNIDAEYISDEIRKTNKLIIISTADMVSGNIEKIDEMITNALKNI